MKKIDRKKIEELTKELLIALGDNPEREGLKETPKRVANMYCEVLEGMQYTNDEIAKMFNKSFIEEESRDLVIVKDIDVFSFCEHHLALIYNAKIHIAYIPNGRVIGLSKLARIADMVSKRLQLQERICSDIVEILEKILNLDNIMVIMEASHSCMTARGIKKANSTTTVSSLRGLFKHSSQLRNEVYQILNKK